VFFLGLLSTPLPYLLLAAFYFFGFAMGMFNNSTGDETSETIAAVTIPAENVKKAPEQSTFYYQIGAQKTQIQKDNFQSENNFTSFFPDTGPVRIYIPDIKIKDFHFSGFRFSRPPPSVC
jgi:hypothetical protein